MPPEVFTSSGLLRINGLQIIESGAGGTCKRAAGRSNIDYLIADHDIAPLIDQMRIVPDVPWKPHVGISFRINRRPEHVMTNQIIKPKPILYEKVEKKDKLLRGLALKKSLMISMPLNRTKQKDALHSPKQLIETNGIMQKNLESRRRLKKER